MCVSFIPPQALWILSLFLHDTFRFIHKNICIFRRLLGPKKFDSLHSQSVYTKVFVSGCLNFIKSMIECSLFCYSYITMIEHTPIVLHTNLYNSHDCARVSQFNLYAKWKEKSQNKYYCLLVFFLFQWKKEEEEDEENNTRKVDNWFSILCFSLSLSPFLNVCI